MTTCNRFDRNGDICRTCGRAVVFTPSRRRNAPPGDGSWQHVGPSAADKLADLLQRRMAEGR